MSMQEKRDIENREDIAQLIRAFYTHAMQDELIGTFFTDVAAINLEEHLPIMYDFWENLLFHTGSYYGGMMQKHIRLHQKKPLESKHFARWLELFEREVDRQFAGPVAEEAKTRARTIAPSMQEKLKRFYLPMTRL
jgi:hemoglobin